MVLTVVEFVGGVPLYRMDKSGAHRSTIGHRAKVIQRLYIKYMTAALTESDEGKRVIEADGTGVGMVTEVRHGTAHVEAEPSVVEALQTELDAGGNSENTYALSEGDIERIEDERIVLRTRS